MVVSKANPGKPTSIEVVFAWKRNTSPTVPISLSSRRPYCVLEKTLDSVTVFRFATDRTDKSK